MADPRIPGASAPESQADSAPGTGPLPASPFLPDPAHPPGAGGDASTGGRAVQECGPLGLRIAADGTWYHQSSPIGRKELVKLFATVLSRDENGIYWMTTPAERGTVEVEDAPFVAVDLTVDGPLGPCQVVRLRTNLDEWVTIDVDHPLRVSHHPGSGEPAPYVYMRNGLAAKVGRAVFYGLVDMAVAAPPSVAAAGQDVIGIWSTGQFFPLGSI